MMIGGDDDGDDDYDDDDDDLGEFGLMVRMIISVLKLYSLTARLSKQCFSRPQSCFI